MKHYPLFLKVAVCLLLLCAIGTAKAQAQSTTPVPPLLRGPRAQAQSTTPVPPLLRGPRAQAQSTTPVPPSSRGALDIGPVGHTGAFIETGDTDRIWGSGSDIWGQHDHFHYVWYDLPADGQLVTQVRSQEATDTWAKAGIMVRETTADNAANVFLALTPGHGVTFQWRTVTNASSTNSRSGPQETAPVWLKLVKHKTTITGFVSTDGTTWTSVSSVEMAMGATSSIGLAVTARDNGRSRVVFTHVKLTPGSQLPALTATRVYGQGGSFTTATQNTGGVSANSLNYPAGMITDSSGNLYASDCNNNRVLYYPAGSTVATRIYGQGGSFTTATINTGGVSASSLSCPYEIALDRSDNLYVADYRNNRVLYYPAGSTTATRVYGQGGSFTTATQNTGGVSANSLYGPVGVILDSNDNLYVADYNNNRVLYYPAGSTTATRVYGQGGSFTTATQNTGGTSPNSLYGPWSVKLDSSGNLYVSDYNNNRVLYYPAGSTTATRVYGQGGSFTTMTSNTGGIDASGLNGPGAIVLDSSDNLYIADDGNNRVLYYPVGSTTATQVYGQGGSFTTMTSNTGGVSAASFNDPEGITLDSSGNLYVADSSNNRVLMFPHA